MDRRKSSPLSSAGSLSRRQVLALATTGLTTAFAASLDKAAPAAADTATAVLNFDDYGTCDGVTDDGGPFRQALSDLADAGGGVLLLPAKPIAVTITAQPYEHGKISPSFLIPANTRIAGTSDATRIYLSSSNPTVFCGFIGNAGNNVSIENITFVRSADCNMVFFAVGAYEGFRLAGCVIDGRQPESPHFKVHGMYLDRPGEKRNITLDGCTIRGVRYGIIQNNDVTSTVDTVTVDACTFSANVEDLGFNSPNATMRNITVANSKFYDSAADTYCGYGVSFAHVDNAVVRNCEFTNYRNEAIHLEDHSTNILLADNRLVSCGNSTADFGSGEELSRILTEADRGGIVVVSGCSDITITGNTLDHSANTNNLHGIVVKKLQAAETPGGRPDVAPRRVTISNNVVLCGPHYQGLWVANAEDITIRDNRITGAGYVRASVWNDGNKGFGIRIDGVRTRIERNEIEGFRYGVGGPVVTDAGVGSWSTRKALGNPGTVTANRVTNCYVGILAVPAGTLTISGNAMVRCLRPMVVGEGEYAALAASVTGNTMSDCTYPLEVDGTLVLVRSPGGSAVTTGFEKTVDVIDVLRTIPAGTIVHFEQGASFRVTTPITAPGLWGDAYYKLVGDVFGGDINMNENGLTVDLAHSNLDPSNKILVSGNKIS